jgi:hypothetical protein
MSTETCAYCDSENYACGTTEEEMSKGDIRSPRLYQSDLCREREARQKAEAKVQELDSLLIELKENAQLDELEAISFALGTNEGHSSVDHIVTLKAEVDRLFELLLRAINEIEKAPFHAPKLTAFTAHRLAERYRDEMTNNSTNTPNTQENDK